MKSSLFAACALVSAAAGLAQASNIATIEGDTSGTAVTLDSSPVVTAILSQPGTVGAKTYTSWSFLVQDSTGSMALYGAMPSGSSYTPSVGDVLATNTAGTYAPYHQIPEIGPLTAISASSSGQAVPGALSETVANLNQTTLPFSIAGHLITVSNVTISGFTAGATFGDGSSSANNLTLTMTDSTGNMTLYYWPTSYSVAAANLNGTAIPSGPVNITGIDSVYNSTSPEFIPVSITPVPEPACLSLLGLGAAGLLARRRQH